MSMSGPMSLSNSPAAGPHAQTAPARVVRPAPHTLPVSLTLTPALRLRRGPPSTRPSPRRWWSTPRTRTATGWAPPTSSAPRTRPPCSTEALWSTQATGSLCMSGPRATAAVVRPTATPPGRGSMFMTVTRMFMRGSGTGTPTSWHPSTRANQRKVSESSFLRTRQSQWPRTVRRCAGGSTGWGSISSTQTPRGEWSTCAKKTSWKTTRPLLQSFFSGERDCQRRCWVNTFVIFRSHSTCRSSTISWVR